MSALLVLFSSCNGNDDDNGSSGSDVVLLKKTIENGPDGQYISTATYNGTKLVKIETNDAEKIQFTYTGDDITMMEWFADGELEQRDLFTYATDGKLATYTSLDLDFGSGTKEVYTQNSDNTITVTGYSGDLDSQTIEEGTSTITFVNGEVSQIVDPFGTTTYTYDNKNNPFKNVTGYSKISYIDGSASGILHNVISENYEGDDSTYTFTYDPNDFPATAVEDFDGEQYTTQFVYQ